MSILVSDKAMLPISTYERLLLHEPAQYVQSKEISKQANKKNHTSKTL